MPRPSQSSDPSTSAPSITTFDEDVVTSCLVNDTSFEYDTYDAFGAFGASDALLNDNKREEFIEALLEHGAMVKCFIDDAAKEGDSIANNNHNTSSCASGVKTSTSSHSPHRVNAPVKSSASSQTHRLTHSLPTSRPYDSCDRDHSTFRTDEPLPTLPRKGQALTDHRLYKEQGGTGGEEGVAAETVRRSTSPTLVSSKSSRSDSPPFPMTPLDKPCETAQTEDVKTAPHNISPTGHSDRADRQLPANERIYLSLKAQGKRKAHEPEYDPHEESVEAHMVRGESIGSQPSPGSEPTSPATSLGGRESDAGGDHPVPGPSQPDSSTHGPSAAVSQKRKRSDTAGPRAEAPKGSDSHGQRRAFVLEVLDGKTNRSDSVQTKDVEVEAESCCRTVGEKGFCHFQNLDEGSRCDTELPKDGPVTRAHLNMHIAKLKRRGRNHHWDPVCPWCNKRRTKVEQLVRHVLDTHLHMFVQKCACGGSMSRSNQQNNAGRHENSKKHREYLKGLAEEAKASTGQEQGPGQSRIDQEEEEEEDFDDTDVQSEFVQGSSTGRKRRRF